MKNKFLILILVLWSASPAWANDNIFDTYFGQDGQVIKSIVDAQEDRGEVAAIDSKGRFYVAGVAGIPDNIDFFVARYLPDGKPDLSFGKEGIVIHDLGGEDHVHGLAVSPKGIVYVAGYVKKDKRADFAVLSLNSDGSLNESFGRHGVSLTKLDGWAEAHFAAVLADGALLAAGFVEKNGDSDLALVKYLPDGNTDASFAKDGVMILDWTRKDRLYGLTLTSKLRSQKILVTGSAMNAGSGEDCLVAEYNLDGTRNKDFGFGGFSLVSFGVYQDVCSSVDVTKNGQIIVAGYRNNKEGTNADFAVARLKSNGVIDTSFGRDGYKMLDFDGGIDVAHALTELPNGDLLVIGESEVSSSTGKQVHFSGYRLNSQGLPVLNWGTNGKMMTTFAQGFPEVGLGLVMDKKGNVLVVGQAQDNMALLKVLTVEDKKKKTH